MYVSPAKRNSGRNFSRRPFAMHFSRFGCDALLQLFPSPSRYEAKSVKVSREPISIFSRCPGMNNAAMRIGFRKGRCLVLEQGMQSNKPGSDGQVCWYCDICVNLVCAIRNGMHLLSRMCESPPDKNKKNFSAREGLLAGLEQIPSVVAPSPRCG